MAVQLAKSFDTVVAKAFHFLVAELGLSGPSTGGPSAVAYTGHDVCYQVFLDPLTQLAIALLSAELGAKRLDSSA